MAKKFQIHKNLKASLLVVGISIIPTAISFAFIIGFSMKAPFSVQQNAYSATYHVTLWHVAALAFGALAFLIGAFVRLLRSHDQLNRGYVTLQLQVTSMYLWFTAVIGILSFLILFVAPSVI